MSRNYRAIDIMELAKDERFVEEVACRLYGGADWTKRERWASGVADEWLDQARTSIKIVAEVLDEQPVCELSPSAEDARTTPHVSRVAVYLDDFQVHLDSTLRHVNEMQYAFDESETWERSEDRDWIQCAWEEALHAHRVAETRLQLGRALIGGADCR